MYRVLIIDMDPMSRKLMEILIASHSQYILVPSLCGTADAERYCEENPADVILLDMMTAMDCGDLEIIERLKRHNPDRKIIPTTSLPEYSFLTRAKKAGADSFWYKEASAESLHYVLGRTLEGESVYPDSTPAVQLGNACSMDFTLRELEVLRELLSGKTDAAIAENLKLSVATVKFHIQKIREKTGFTTRTEMAVQARECGLVVSR